MLLPKRDDCGEEMPVLDYVSKYFRRSTGFLWRHIAEALLPAICVAAIVTVLHENTPWLDPVDALVFTNISNSASYQKLLAEKSPGDEQRLLLERRATVISIDTDSYTADYGERVPLSRCQLKNHLDAIYGQQPALLVIDLDLSPAKWLQNVAQAEPGMDCSVQDPATKMNAACQARCETELYDLIKRPRPTKTVLMLPFGLTNLAEGRRSERYKNWTCSMDGAGVDIGQPLIRESMGIILRVAPAADALARLACMRMKEAKSWFCEKRRRGHARYADRSPQVSEQHPFPDNFRVFSTARKIR